MDAAAMAGLIHGLACTVDACAGKLVNVWPRHLADKGSAGVMSLPVRIAHWQADITITI
jgi:hypothetical protein